MPTGKSQERRGEEQEKGEIKACQSFLNDGKVTNGIQGMGLGGPGLSKVTHELQNTKVPN